MATTMLQMGERSLTLVDTDETSPAKTLDERLQESDREISEAWVALNKRSMLIGWQGYFIKRNAGWERLGYADEKHYRSAKGIGRST